MSHKRRLVSSSDEDDVLPSIQHTFEQDTDVESVRSASYLDPMPTATLRTVIALSSATSPEPPTKRIATLVGMEAYASDDDAGPACEIQSETIRVEVLPVTPPREVVTDAAHKKVKKSKKDKKGKKEKKFKKARRDSEPEPVSAPPTAETQKVEVAIQQPTVQLCPLPFSVAGLPRIPKLSQQKPISPVRPQRANPASEEFPSSFVSRATGQRLDRLKAETERRDCSDCGATFDRHSKLLAHVRRAHALVTVCVCGYRSLSRDNVTRHQRTMASRGVPHLKAATVSTDQEKEFKERFCRPVTITRTVGNAPRFTAENEQPALKDETVEELRELRKRVEYLEEKLEAIRAALG